MESPDAGIWHHIPGYDSDSCGSNDEEEKAVQATAKERLSTVLELLGSHWMEAPPIRFDPVVQPKVWAKEKEREKSGSRPAPPARRFSGVPPSYRLEHINAPLVRDMMLSNGLAPAHNQDWCVQWSGPGMKDSAYQNLHEFQRVNHFPGGTELTRKDSMYVHLNDMADSFGRDSFDFIPDTFVLPDQLEEFLELYEREKGLWIVKPHNAACGRGIFILRDLGDLPLDELSVVSRYVENPLLIQGLKFDLRVYVLVTQYEPLRAYIYREGLARFASKPYSVEDAHLGDAYRHLTNYSINKYAPNFIENKEVQADNYGHKWSLSALNKHLACIGTDSKLMWTRIMDLIVKTLLAVEPTIGARTRSCMEHDGVCFEIYGFDVLVDEDLKPWILEVNLSPSMQADSPLDWQVKSSLLSDAFNLIGVCHASQQMVAVSRCRAKVFQSHAKERQAMRDRVNRILGVSNMAPRPVQRGRSKSDCSASGARFRRAAAAAAKAAAAARAPVVSEEPVALDTLSESQLKLLARSLQEFTRCNNFIRLYPTRAAVDRYAPITQARLPRLRGSAAAALPPAARLTPLQLLASVLFGPRPVHSAPPPPPLPRSAPLPAQAFATGTTRRDPKSSLRPLQKQRSLAEGEESESEYGGEDEGEELAAPTPASRSPKPASSPKSPKLPPSPVAKKAIVERPRTPYRRSRPSSRSVSASAVRPASRGASARAAAKEKAAMSQTMKEVQASQAAAMQERAEAVLERPPSAPVLPTAVPDDGGKQRRLATRHVPVAELASCTWSPSLLDAQEVLPHTTLEEDASAGFGLGAYPATPPSAEFAVPESRLLAPGTEAEEDAKLRRMHRQAAPAERASGTWSTAALGLQAAPPPKPQLQRYRSMPMLPELKRGTGAVQFSSSDGKLMLQARKLGGGTGGGAPEPFRENPALTNFNALIEF